MLASKRLCFIITDCVKVERGEGDRKTSFYSYRKHAVNVLSKLFDLAHKLCSI